MFLIIPLFLIVLEKMADAMEFDLQDKSAHISSLNKTPASIIQEYAIKNHLIPQYELIHNGIAESKVIFKYMLTLDGYETVGEGSSKKEAKHQAAFKLLKKIIEDKPQLLKTKFQQWDFENRVVSPFDNNIKENVVGKLNDICGTNRLGLPEFNLVREEGQAHAKLFTISCQVGKMIERATHKTKKQAKHLAAVQMVSKLQSIDKSLVMDDEPHVSDSIKVLEQVESIKLRSEFNIKKNAPMDVDICNFHLILKKSVFPNTDTLNKVIKQYFSCGKLDESNPRATLNQIVDECEMRLVEKSVSKDILGKSSNYFYFISITSVYPPVFGSGVDYNIEKAKNLAAIDLIINLCILFK